MLCEVLTVKSIGDRSYATVKAGDLVGELPVAKGVQVVSGDRANIVPTLGVWAGRLQARVVLKK